MSNIIGYNKPSDRRQTLWNCLVSLREVIKEDRKNNNIICLKKEITMYNNFLDKYIH